MIYQVFFTDENNRRKVLYDIEFYLTYTTDNKKNEKLWYSEIRVLPIGSNIINYVYNYNNGQDFEKLAKDCETIEWLRGWLYEQNDNSPLPMDDASKRHYKFFNPKIHHALSEFCSKNSLELNID